MTVIVVDTSVLVSGLLWGGAPGEIIEGAGEGRWDIRASEELIKELAGVLSRPRFQPKLTRLATSADALAARFRSHVQIVPASPQPSIQSRDPKDDKVLACAEGAQADYLVTGNDDLLVLGRIGRTRIVTVRTFLDENSGQGR